MRARACTHRQPAQPRNSRYVEQRAARGYVYHRKQGKLSRHHVVRGGSGGR